MPKQKTILILMLIAFLLCSAGSTLIQPPGWKLHNVTGHLPDLQFTLTDDQTKTVTQDTYPATLKLVYFGFTSCPDQCPLMMGRLTSLLKTLSKDADHVHIFFITIDPARDSIPVLHRYLQALDPAHMTGLTGEKIPALAKRFRNVYRPGVIMHSDAVYIFDFANRARLIATSQDSDEALLHDIQRLLHEQP